MKPQEGSVPDPQINILKVQSIQLSYITFSIWWSFKFIFLKFLKMHIMNDMNQPI